MAEAIQILPNYQKISYRSDQTPHPASRNSGPNSCSTKSMSPSASRMELAIGSLDLSIQADFGRIQSKIVWKPLSRP